MKSKTCKNCGHEFTGVGQKKHCLDKCKSKRWRRLQELRTLLKQLDAQGLDVIETKLNQITHQEITE